MTDPAARCPDDVVLVELALGHLTGRERAEALAHLLQCRACREQTDMLTEVSEHLLLAAPEAEPPAGFESVVVGRLTPEPRSRPRRSVAVALAGAVALVAAAFAGGLLVSDDGREVAEAAMVTPGGRDVGRAWRYDSDPSWVFLSVPGWEVWEDPAGSPLDYELHAELDDGTQVALGDVTFRNDGGTWATATRVDTARITSVAIVDQTGRVWCQGEF